jgi:hypothetical protein
MNLKNRIESLTKLHIILDQYDQNALKDLAFRMEQNNPWFTENNVLFAIKGISKLISPDSLKRFEEKYAKLSESNKSIGLVLAGNIPAVGFHDVLITVLSGAKAFAKLSSEDRVLLPFIWNELKQIDAELAAHCAFVERLDINALDAIIATGSDNTARYFEQYFSKKPNIIRKSRTSVAVLRGNESVSDLQALVGDITQYFGLGCRNVSKVLVLGETDIIPLLQEIEKHTVLSNFSKYDNNYLYYKSIYLVNREPFLDTENMLFKETELLSSPISVLYYQRFETEEAINNYITENKEKLQCVLGNKEKIGFGEAQSPSILDYPDGVDVREFISELG